MVYHMLARVGSTAQVPALIAEVKSGRGKLYGFGHRVYETVDPRAGFVKEILGGFERRKFEIVEVAEEIERCASEDEWFRSRNIRMNVDLFGCFVYTALYVALHLLHPFLGWKRLQWIECIGVSLLGVSIGGTDGFVLVVCRPRSSSR